MKPFCEENKSFGADYLLHSFNGAMFKYRYNGNADAIVSYCKNFGTYTIDTIRGLREDVTNLIVYLHRNDEWNNSVIQLGIICIAEYVPYYCDYRGCTIEGARNVSICTAHKICDNGNVLIYVLDGGCCFARILRWKPVTALDIAEEYCTSTNNGTK